MRRIILFITAAFVLAACTSKQEFDFDALNRQAGEEYLQTIRCSEENGPFWNVFADKFIYAPAFDFPKEAGAEKYKFSIRYIDNIYRTPIPSRDYLNGKNPRPSLTRINEIYDSNAGKGEWTFEAYSPKVSLAPVWNEITVGNVILKVEALDKERKVIETVGGLEFLRDFPFSGPYFTQARSYSEAARRALIYNHEQSFTKFWLENDYPDPAYILNGYVCKILGATIKSETKLMQLIPSYREECLAIARKVADFMIRVAQAPGTPLEYFPPTYYPGYIGLAESFVKETMGMEAAVAADAFLDLYDACEDRKYYDQAIGIARTYCRIQAEDGSVPIKLFIETGEAVNDVKATPINMLGLFRRFEKQYGITEFRDALAKGEEWMYETAFNTFYLTGQFEDQDVRDLQPFQNLCNASSGGYATYLLERDNRTATDLKIAKEMLALAEDQFVHWDVLAKADGTKEGTTPCVYEQYEYKTPIDASAVQLGKAFFDEYQASGDKLALAKAKALADALTRAQDPRTGLFNTYFRYDTRAGGNYWLNCNLASALFIGEIADFFE